MKCCSTSIVDIDNASIFWTLSIDSLVLDSGQMERFEIFRAHYYEEKRCYLAVDAQLLHKLRANPCHLAQCCQNCSIYCIFTTYIVDTHEIYRDLEQKKGRGEGQKIERKRYTGWTIYTYMKSIVKQTFPFYFSSFRLLVLSADFDYIRLYGVALYSI